MTQEQIAKRIKDLEAKVFFCEMADFMTYEDKEFVRVTNQEIRKLKLMLD